MTWSEALTQSFLERLKGEIDVPVAAQMPPEMKPPFVLVGLESLRDPHTLTGAGEASFVCTIVTQSKGFVEGRQLAERVQFLLERAPLVLEEVGGLARAQQIKEKNRIESDRVTRKIEQHYCLRLKKN